MKRIIALFALLLSFAIITGMPVQAAKIDLVTDGAKLLTKDERLELNQLAKDITEKYKCEVSIAIVNGTGADDVTKFTKSVYNKYDFGYGEDKSGMILLLSVKERDYAMVAYGYGNTAFTDHGKDVLADRYLLPLLGEDQYYEAFSTYLNKTGELLSMARDGTPLDVSTDKDSGSFWVSLAIVIFVPLLIAGIVCFVLLQQMKTAVPQVAADSYISDMGVNLTMQDDKFLFRTETRTRIEKSSSSGGTSVGRDGSSSKSGKY